MIVADISYLCPRPSVSECFAANGLQLYPSSEDCPGATRAAYAARIVKTQKFPKPSSQGGS